MQTSCTSISLSCTLRSNKRREIREQIVTKQARALFRPVLCDLRLYMPQGEHHLSRRACPATCIAHIVRNDMADNKFPCTRLRSASHGMRFPLSFLSCLWAGLCLALALTLGTCPIQHCYFEQKNSRAESPDFTPLPPLPPLPALSVALNGDEGRPALPGDDERCGMIEGRGEAERDSA